LVDICAILCVRLIKHISSIVAVTGLTPIVRQPTRGINVLDQLYVSDPWVFDAVRLVKSVVKSDHLAVVAYTERDNVSLINQTTRVHYRRVTPGQHAVFLSTSEALTSPALLQILSVSRQHSTIFTASHSDCLTSSTLRERLPSGLAIPNTSRRTSSRCCIRRTDLRGLGESRRRVLSHGVWGRR